jgi:hypothetical protein
MYATVNYKTKKALKQAVAVNAGDGVPCFQPGPFGPDVKDGEHCCEGPHYPEPHRWYATVTVKDGRIVKVK